MCTDEIKNMCAQISIKYKLSVEIARLAVKIVLKSLYNHDVYLSIKGKKEIKSGIYTVNRVLCLKQTTKNILIFYHLQKLLRTRTKCKLLK